LGMGRAAPGDMVRDKEGMEIVHRMDILHARR